MVLFDLTIKRRTYSIRSEFNEKSMQTINKKLYIDIFKDVKTGDDAPVVH